MLFPKPTKTKRGNTKRKITEELFESCLARDGGCVICGTTNDLDRPHHCYFGSSSNLGSDRNNLSQVVTICRIHHNKLHFEGGNSYREDCITYLENLGY